jgi:hypothetical protein
MRTEKYMKAVLAVIVLCVPSSGQDQNLAEAKKMAHQLWEKMLTKCGNYYYYFARGQQRLTQYTGVTFDILPRVISRADQMNGIQWKGFAAMTSSASRSQLVRGHERWGTWQGWLWSDSTVTMAQLKEDPHLTAALPSVVFMTKNGGQWSFSVDFHPDNNDVSKLDEIALGKPSCAAIPDAALPK